MEPLIVLIILGIFGAILIFPIWTLALLYSLKSAQDKMNSELQKLIKSESQKRTEETKQPQPAAAAVPPPATKPEPAMAAKAAEPPAKSAIPEEKKTEAKHEEFKSADSPSMFETEVDLEEIEEHPKEKPPAKVWTPLPPPPPREPTEFEKNARDMICRIWSWIVVGDEHRPKNVSFEYAVASVWLLRSSILIIVTGIGLSLQYSIENNLIGPYGRIAMSIAAGLVMLIAGIKLAGKKYHIIAQGLIGGGIATLYLSIFASYKIYHIIPDAKLSFALMILITIAAAIIAVRLNSMLVAIFGIIGGYCTPIMLSTGTADFPGLFSYMLMLGIGVIVIAKYKDWKILNSLSFVFTYGLYWASMDKFYDKQEDFTVAITFLSLFFLLFAAIPIMNNIVHKQKSNALTLFGMFLNAAAFFPSAAYLISSLFERKWVAAASLSLAAFYILQIFFFLNRKITDRNLLVLLTGFASFFITLTIPLVLSDEWITTAWSLQALVFLWMSCRMKSNFIRMIAYVLYFLAFSHLFIFDFHKNFVFAKNQDYFNEMLTRLMTFGSLIISMALGYRLLKAERNGSGIISSENDTKEFIPKNFSAGIFAGIGAILLFIYLHFEFYYMSRTFYQPCQMPLITLIWTTSIILAALAYSRSSKSLYMVVSVILAFGLLFKVFIFDLVFWNFSIDHLWFPVNSLAEEASMRTIDFLLIVGTFAWAFAILGGRTKDTAKFFGVLSLSMLFVYLTLELNTFLNYKAPLFRAGGISILWGLFGLSFVLGGIIKEVKALRYAGLILFTVVVMKVFFSDLSRLSQLSRIIAFISLGLVVLAGSFVYVKFRESFNTDSKSMETSDEKKT
ncbi:MAG TPA: hypothetical protein DET40_02100 [Lentisphaeria bacterium]|nr:MAG: hypothetical protein A2X45_10210 [Lentisphaerae bacterium GWF2_50_93]HCE42324.1 hypothetical protein [Lentisphaeria bacterium]